MELLMKFQKIVIVVVLYLQTEAAFNTCKFIRSHTKLKLRE